MISFLIADDHPVVLTGFIEILQGRVQGSVFEEASDGGEVIKKVLARNYNLVICDLSMPGKSGIEVLEQVTLFNQKLPKNLLKPFYSIKATSPTNFLLINNFMFL